MISLALWHLIVVIGKIPDYILPSPGQVFAVFGEDATLIGHQVLYTLAEWVVGIGLSTVIAVVLATLCFRYRGVNAFVSPLLVVTQTIPFLAVAPLLMIWLGLGMTPKIVLIVLSCAFPIALSLQEGLESARQEYRVVVAMMDLSWWRALWHVYGPSSLPHFFTGLKISASYAFITTVMAELIGSEKGLGIYLVRAQTSYRTDKVIAAILVVITISLLNTVAVDLTRRRVVFWDQTRK